MLKNLKIPFIIIASFFVGAASLYAWSEYTATQQQSNQVTAKPEQKKVAAPSQADPNDEQNEELNLELPPRNTPSPTPVSEKVAPPVPAKGSISGTLGYPSSFIPPLTVYAISEKDPKVYFSVKTQTNQQAFTLELVEPGTYVLVAYPEDTSELAGGYTKAVACGLSVECKDHSLVSVSVEAGKTVSGVEIKDWYAPEGTFPKKPQ